MRDELGRRISDFHQEAFYFHNTYLEVLVEHGLLGLLLYALDGLGPVPPRPQAPRSFLGRVFPINHSASIWPLMLAVYFVNASFVGMNYQFVNVLLFTIAGILAAQNRVEDEARPCPVKGQTRAFATAVSCRSLWPWHLVSLGNMLVLTWWIGPHAYGTFATAVAIAAFLASLARLGIDTYLVRSVSPPSARTFQIAGTLTAGDFTHAGDHWGNQFPFAHPLVAEP